jgi:protein gp37
MVRLGVPQYRDNHVVDEQGRWTGETFIVPSKLLELVRTTKGKPYFIGSMTDLFHENSPTEWHQYWLAAMAMTPWNFFYVLTKRPERMLAAIERMQVEGVTAAIEGLVAYLHSRGYTPSKKALDKVLRWHHAQGAKPLPNLALGTSCGVPSEVDDRLDPLTTLDGAGWNTWVSAEPLLAKTDFRLNKYKGGWIVTGGESEQDYPAREFHLEWAADILIQASLSTTPFFFKQLGDKPMYQGQPYQKKSSHGGKMEEFPEGLRVRQPFTLALQSYTRNLDDFKKFA